MLHRRGIAIEDAVVRDEANDEKLDVTKTLGELNVHAVKIINTKVADDSVSISDLFYF